MEGNRKDRRTKQQCLPPLHRYPWLLYLDNEVGKKNQIFCRISDPTITYTRNIPELGDAELWTIQHGWCLLANLRSNAYNLFLWNPCSLQKIVLPPVTCDVGIGCDCILSPSRTTTGQVCSIFLFSPYITSIFYCQLGDEQWTEVDYREEMASAMKGKNASLVRCKSYLIKNPVYCNGCIYAESFESFLVVIEEQCGNRCLNINPIHALMPTIPPTRFHRISRLLGYNNELFRIEIVHTLDRVIYVAIYKFKFSLLVWEKVKSIKDKVFFISCVDSPLVCQAINPKTEGGRIYFTIPDKNCVYIYNIEEKSLMFSQPFPNLLETPSCLTWFMPDIRMAADILEEEREKESISGEIHINEKGDTTTKESALSLDVARMIAKRLHGFDYLHFRATDRIFWLGAPPIQRNEMPIRFDDNSLCPLLVFLDKDNVFTFVHPKHGLKYKYTIKLPKVKFLGSNENDDEYLNSDCEICYSKDGWLLLTMNTDCSFFFNPFTKEVKPFKYGTVTIRNAMCVGFSHCPTTYTCVIVTFEESKPLHCKTPIFRLIYSGSSYDLLFDFEHGYFSLDNKSPTFHNGAFYYLSNKGMLGVIKLVRGARGASWKEFKEAQSPCTDSINSFLVECNGDQLSVFEGPFGEWVRVFKLNESTMRWTEVESLGNDMLFVGNTSFSAKANIPGMENKIYFPRFYGKSILFYSLETKKYHTFEDEVVNFESVREPVNCSWIEPRWN